MDTSLSVPLCELMLITSNWTRGGVVAQHVCGVSISSATCRM